ncbi:hypothetical protein TNCV_568831 [Trichonephila clavipes]|nr:hypothetical protein TNCV_568831 [Trichonephila clavipes]
MLEYLKTISTPCQQFQNPGTVARRIEQGCTRITAACYDQYKVNNTNSRFKNSPFKGHKKVKPETCLQTRVQILPQFRVSNQQHILKSEQCCLELLRSHYISDQSDLTLEPT